MHGVTVMINHTDNDHLLCYIARYLAVDVSQLHYETRLEADIGLVGDDAEHFIKEISNTFNMYVNPNFVYEHFHSEFDNLSRPVLDLTISELIEMIKLNDAK